MTYDPHLEYLFINFAVYKLYTSTKRYRNAGTGTPAQGKPITLTTWFNKYNTHNAQLNTQVQNSTGIRINKSPRLENRVVNAEDHFNL
jgi:hypothetical protein